MAGENVKRVRGGKIITREGGNQVRYETRGRTTFSNAEMGAIAALGYDDARWGTDFHPDYDKWPTWKQKCYETGRGVAVVIKGGRMECPDWTGGYRRWPIAILRNYALAASIVGVFGERRQEADLSMEDFIEQMNRPQLY